LILFEPISVNNRLPIWLRSLPFWQNRWVKRAALEIRRLITHRDHMREDQIAAGRAPQDLAARLLSTQDPETGTAAIPN